MIISTREEAELALESCAPLLDRNARRARAVRYRRRIGPSSPGCACRPEGGPDPDRLLLPAGRAWSHLAERFAHVAHTPIGFQAMVG